MLAIPFLIPSFYALSAWSTTGVTTPVETTEAKIFNPDGFSSLFKEKDIRKDTFFIKKDTAGLCEARGTNFVTRGKAVISVDPQFYEADQEACHWEMKRKVSHIKNNDCFTSSSVGAISSLAAALFSLFLLPVIPGLFVTMVAVTVGKIVFSRYAEGKADDFAIANSSDAELKAGRRFIKAGIDSNLKLRRTSGLQTFLISPNGDNRMNFSSPSATSRLKKIEDSLQAQHIPFDDIEELNKTTKLRTFIEKFKLEMENKVKKLGLTGIFKQTYQNEIYHQTTSKVTPGSPNKVELIPAATPND